MEVSLTCRVHFDVLQKYLGKVFKINDYNIQGVTGSRAGMVPEFLVTGVLVDTPNLWQQVDGIRRGQRVRNLGLILDLLCKDGFIPAGKYVIDMTPGVSPLDEYREALYQSGDPSSVECQAIKTANKTTKDFTKRVALLDQRWVEHQSKLPAKEDSDGDTPIE